MDIPINFNGGEDEAHAAYHAKADAAIKAHQERLKADGLVGEERYFNCVLSPGDRIGIKRIGPAGGKSTIINIGMALHGETGIVALSPSEARKFAAALLTTIEECEPDKGLLRTPDSPEGLA